MLSAWKLGRWAITWAALTFMSHQLDTKSSSVQSPSPFLTFTLAFTRCAQNDVSRVVILFCFCLMLLEKFLSYIWLASDGWIFPIVNATWLIFSQFCDRLTDCRSSAWSAVQTLPALLAFDLVKLSHWKTHVDFQLYSNICTITDLYNLYSKSKLHCNHNNSNLLGVYHTVLLFDCFAFETEIVDSLNLSGDAISLITDCQSWFSTCRGLKSNTGHVWIVEMIW